MPLTFYHNDEKNCYRVSKCKI
uniref:Uncharacterized protein n=1 Tax=Rhizophora mucronata TaxID=61149 RepID=A0A2P2NPS3_RHIMU